MYIFVMFCFFTSTIEKKILLIINCQSRFVGMKSIEMNARPNAKRLPSILTKLCRAVMTPNSYKSKQAFLFSLFYFEVLIRFCF